MINVFELALEICFGVNLFFAIALILLTVTGQAPIQETKKKIVSECLWTLFFMFCLLIFAPKSGMSNFIQNPGQFF